MGRNTAPARRSGQRGRRWRWLLASTAIFLIAVLLAPEGRLACAGPAARDASPDGAWTLTLCRRPLPFAMPGASGDAPGWIVLRDAHGAIRGVSSLGMVQLYGVGGTGVQWAPDRVTVPMVAELPLRPAAGPAGRWLEDRAWRLRALLGLTPTDDEFH